MYIEVNTTWVVVGTGGGGNTATGTGTAFNTDTKQIEQWNASRNQAILDPKPPDAHLPVGSFLWFDCDVNLTATKYFYAGGMDVRVETEPNSVAYCGFTPPLSCQLGGLSVQQTLVGSRTTLTVHFSGLSNGLAYYALDGGAEQTSPVFTGVLPGAHKVQVRDDGLAGCTASLDVEVAAPVTGPVVVAPTVPVGAALGIDFVQQPLWFTVATAPAGARVELELYAESSHGAEDFALVLTLRQLADAAGHVSFRLDTLLLPLLSAFVPPLGSRASQLCTSNLVNYFVRTATYDASGAATRTQGPLRTALRGGLPVEWQDIGYFRFLEISFPLPPCLSWQPAGPGTYAAEAPKRVTPTQPEWLFWLCNLDVPTLRVARAYDLGPGTKPFVEYEELAAPARGWLRQLLAVPLRRPGRGFQRVMVQLETGDGKPLSQPAWYTFVEETPRTRYLLFTNSLGTIDTLRCEGRLELTLEASTQQAERPARPGVPAPAAERQVSDLSASRKLKLATGWLEPEELAWLQDLVLSREVWLAQGQQLRPLDWSKRTLATYSDEPGLRGLLLECDYAYAPTAYAPGTY